MENQIQKKNSSVDPTIKLNKWMAKYIKEELKDININCESVNPQLGNLYHAIKIDESKLNWQEIPNDEDAFNLEPGNGFLYDALSKRKALIKRIWVGYSACLRIDNYVEFKNLMRPIIKGLLIGLKKHLGFGPEQDSIGKYYLTFDIPNQKGGYFRQLENSAAFELRALSDCVATNTTFNSSKGEKT